MRISESLRAGGRALLLLALLPMVYAFLGPLVGLLIAIFASAGFALLALPMALSAAYEIGIQPAAAAGFAHAALLSLNVRMKPRLFAVAIVGGLATCIGWYYRSTRSYEALSLSGAMPWFFFGCGAATLMVRIAESWLAFARPKAPNSQS
jgi:hypothetical protein